MGNWGGRGEGRPHEKQLQAATGGLELGTWDISRRASPYVFMLYIWVPYFIIKGWGGRQEDFLKTMTIKKVHFYGDL